MKSRFASFAGKSAFLLLAAALWLSFPASATVTASAQLGAGGTTADGKLTLVVVTMTNRSLSVALMNNSARAVVIDTYSVSPGDSYRCTGRNITMASHSTRQLCTVMIDPYATGASPSPLAFIPGRPSPPAITYTPIPNLGHASLQLSLTYHQVNPPKPRPTATPTASAAPPSPAT